MRFTSLTDWLAWLEASHPTQIELGLERIAQVADRLGLDVSRCKVVSVAGTNGKGSCVAALSAIAQAAGWQVGCYTSPHFLRYNERIVINGNPVSDEALITSFDRIDQARKEISLTYFEFGTLAALDIFQHAELDLIVLEVGLGGRLDAVNLIDADISVVTSIDLDHQDWLGDNREAIGFEKAGIFRTDRPAICADDCPPQSLLDHASEIGAQLLLKGRDFDLIECDDGSYQWWCEGDPARVLTVPGLNRLCLPQPSIAAAIEVASCLGLTETHWACLNTLTLPGRYQPYELQGRRIILDVAHNPQAAAYLAQRLQSDKATGQRYALFAAMADKDTEGMLAPLVDCFDGWAVSGLPGNARAMSVGSMAVTLSQLVDVPVSAFDDVPQACAQLLSGLEAGDELVIFGSFFTVAAAMAYLQALS